MRYRYKLAIQLAVFLLPLFLLGGLLIWMNWQQQQYGRLFSRLSELLIGSTILLSLLLAYYFHRQLVADNNRFKQILQTTRNVVITVNDREVITGFNRIAEEIFQLPAARALGRKFSQVFTGRQAPGEIAFTYPLSEVMRSGQGRCNDERPYQAADGWPYTLRIDCLPLDKYRGRTMGAVLIMRDVTEQKIVEEKLQGLAVRDSLTLLYNHRYLRRRLQQELARARQLRSRVAFLLMDIDNFKYYNDRFGHPAGDALLISFARLLSSHLRQSDVLARYGGDEFAVILPDSDLKTAFEVAERLRNLVATYPFPHHNELPEQLLSISVGIAIYPDDATGAVELIRLADEAMYAAKRSSKNRVEIYFSALREFQKELAESDPQFINTARTLLTLINAKDRYTYAHSEQVARLSAMMAAALNLPVQQQQDIHLAAFLHDLGKLDIPGDILNKAGPLTAEEWELIKQDPAQGADMISDFPQIRHLKPLILHHHERFDGSGYPECLRGEQIPLGARIIAVADSYDAMTTQRPYKKALSPRDAIAELQAGSGSQFDPQAVQVLLQVLHNLEQSHEALYSRQTG